ncbi:beta-galactosidase [Candidatus Parcubacteria bacterium]|nr:beta-galactosidase [Candidatus Parcubacteria bacterium]
MRKAFKYILFGFLGLFLIFVIFIGYFFLGTPPEAEKIIWGVNFSQKHAKDMGLDWQECYLSLLDDLGVKNIKILTHWDLIEPKQGEYNFKDLDWQIKTAEEKGADIFLVLGRKTGRWPECHIPEWAKNLRPEEQEQEVLKLLKKIVLRYKDSEFISRWQVENEPFFVFGECPEIKEKFVKKEINLVKSLDSSRQIIISDSGEFSLWIRAARLGDMVGTTMYLKTWFTPAFLNKWQRFKHVGRYSSSPLPPAFYWRKAQIIKKLFNKKIICVELQAEPWGPVLLYDSPLEEQEKSMDLEQFRKNIDFAKKTGLDEFYLWGSEWWYWLKIEKNQPEIWQEAKLLFINQ